MGCENEGGLGDWFGLGTYTTSSRFFIRWHSNHSFHSCFRAFRSVPRVPWNAEVTHLPHHPCRCDSFKAFAILEVWSIVQRSRIALAQ